MSRWLIACLAALVLVAGCAEPSATPRPSDTPAASVSATAGPSAPSPSALPTGTATAPSESAEPSATASADPLSLDPPDEADDRVVNVTVAPEVPADGDGRIVVTVTSTADERIDELVLRWATALDETLFLAPFRPSEERIVEGGPPLVQPWTKWVVGPGEDNEPEGTTSLGWGPLLPGATLTIPVLVTREAAGPVEFDLQVLAGNALLRLPDGEPAERRVTVP